MNNIKLTFVDNTVRVNNYGKMTKALITSGFKFNTFDTLFNYMLGGIPSTIVELLESYGYRRDYDLGMWITTTSGTSKCNGEDEFDEVKGRRVALSRAKKNAYNRAKKLMWDMCVVLDTVSEKFFLTRMDMEQYFNDESVAIDNVIEKGTSR